jgi:arylsulfatase A-like enzyme
MTAKDDRDHDGVNTSRRNLLLGCSTLAATAVLATAMPTRTARGQAPQPAPGGAGGPKPNILVIWGDDIGQGIISAYTKGVMDYRTPDIDRIANEGLIFTDYYGEQSCTAGRSSFITGQSVFRTVDDETVAAAIAFIERQVKAGIPFFVWWSGTHMHFRTHVADKDRGISGQDEYSDAMVLHDRAIGQFLQKLDELGIADNTIVFYSTDNGPHQNTWPDAGTTPFRSEKNTNWEGAWRVPAMVRWPGHIKPASVSNDIMHHMDWLPTFLAVAGNTDVKQKLLDGSSVGGATYKVHLDGYNALPFLRARSRRVRARKSSTSRTTETRWRSATRIGRLCS